MNQSGPPIPGMGFFSQPLVKTVTLLGTGIVLAFVVIAYAKMSSWGIAAIFALVETLVIYLAVTAPVSNGRAERVRSLLHEHGFSDRQRGEPRQAKAVFRLYLEFRASEPAALRRRLRLSLAFAVFCSIALICIGGSLR